MTHRNWRHSIQFVETIQTCKEEENMEKWMEVKADENAATLFLGWISQIEQGVKRNMDCNWTPSYK